jgi:hypothetical protein
MVTLPRTPSGWNDQSTSAPQETSPPDFNPDNMSGGLLDGWQSPAWSLENSGLGLVLRPDIIARIDFGGEGDSPSLQAPDSMAGKLSQERGYSFSPENDLNMDNRDGYQIAQAGGPLPYYMRLMPGPRPGQLPVLDRARMEIDGGFDTHAEAPGAIKQMVRDTAAGVYQGRIVEDFNRDWFSGNTPLPIPKDRTYWVSPGGISPIGRTPSYETKYGRTYVDRNGDRKPDLEMQIDPKTREPLVNYGDGAGFRPYDPKRVVQPPYIEPPNLSRKIPLK